VKALMPDVALDLRFLRYAIAAAEHGSFRKAAAVLDVPQSTVSRRILLLENKLGFPLFIREKSGVKLTVAGANFLNDSVAGVQHLSRAAQLAAATHRGEQGTLQVGIIASVANGYLHSVLRTFRERYPNLQIVLREKTPLEALHGLATGHLDVSFMSGQHDVRGYNSKVLWRESVYVVLPVSHPLIGQELVSWRELRDEAFITSHGGTGPEIERYLMRRLSAPGFRPRIDVHDVSGDNLFNLVAMGYGVTLTSTSSLRREAEGISFRPIAGELNKLPSSAVWSFGNANPALGHFLRLAEKIAREWSNKAKDVTSCVIAFVTSCLLYRIMNFVVPTAEALGTLL
jgi:DNA-binding transcriptional LysR family regulator